MKAIRFPILALSVFAMIQSLPPVAMAELGWPDAKTEAKPWTRWWWLGSAVSEAEISRELAEFAGAGIGGVEICPIYGIQGQETRHIDFLSPRWMEMLAHTAKEAKRLGLGLDMTTGTGWPFGGPWVDKNTASASLHQWEAKVESGKWPGRPQGQMLVAMARHKDGAWSDVTKLVAEGAPVPPALDGAVLRGLFLRSGIQNVKRAAPGAAGLVVDPFSKPAIDHYLARFDKAFAGYDAPFPRAHFHDSFSTTALRPALTCWRSSTACADTGCRITWRNWPAMGMRTPSPVSAPTTGPPWATCTRPTSRPGTIGPASQEA